MSEQESAPARYLSQAAIGRRLGLGRHAVATWRNRYKDTPTPFPAPDVIVGDDEVDERSAPGWHPDRMGEIEEWKRSLPGQGSGGGRPRKEQQAATEEIDHDRDSP